MANRYCPDCGYEVEGAQEFCVRCGTRVPALKAREGAVGRGAEGERAGSDPPASRNAGPSASKRFGGEADSNSVSIGGRSGGDSEVVDGHTGLEKVFIGLLYIGAVVTGLGTSVVAGSMLLGDGQSKLVGSAIGSVLVGGLFAWVQWWLAVGVRRFDQTAWKVAVFLLWLGIAGDLITMIAALAGGAPVTAGIALIFFLLYAAILKELYDRREAFSSG